MAANSGLEGVVAASTRLSHVDGQRGELIIAGFPLAELAGNATFEETTWLLWNGRLPTSAELDGFRGELAGRRALPAPTVALLRECARAAIDPMDALRIAAGTISLDADDAASIVAKMPTIVAAFWRLRAGSEPIAPRADLSHAANYLYMLDGATPDSVITDILQSAEVPR